jgi:hypothetical protein
MAKLLTFALLFIAFITTAQHNPDRCGYSKAMQNLIAQHPEIQAELDAFFQQKAELERIGSEMISTRAIVTIPIVFHVIHSGEAIGLGRNISTTRSNNKLTA